MQNRRSSTKEITPESEDKGLFKKDLGQFRVALVPHVKRSSRGDLVIRGYLNDKDEIFVVFAGRRTKDAVAVETRLKNMLAQANQAAARTRSAPPEINSIRLPIHVEGAWRPRFQSSDSGWDHRSYQFLAARWAFTDVDGMTSLGGRPPFS
ncbi:hypothetical protein [Pseudophaeobacter sp.]|uniref:hypothetical protein n=1 Tax=Pseudophaeobacter sp. TaxID=1971739 RepID=UPI00405A39FC